MSDLKMSVTEREAFLAGLHVGVLGIERADGPPLVLPVWYSYEPGGEVVVLTSASSLKGRLAAAAGRASIVAQQEELPYKYVSVEGSIEIDELGADSHHDIEPMAIRYLGEEMGKGYAAAGVAADEIRIRIRPQRWWTGDYSKSM